MANEYYRKISKVVILGMFIHFMLFAAVMDIYFASPIEKGMTPYKMKEPAPAKRLVLIVADGLRAESIYEEKHEQRSPFITEVRRQRGSWGVSHTRVPTESRPGHVAMMAGIYEDPSAIFKGWKANPVDFDSVLNESVNSWCWGSPDIVNLFNKESKIHIKIESYEAELEDFGGTDTYLLDTWVFDKVKYLIQNETADLQNCKVCGEGNIFFLHLLGLDTAGHSHKPNSKRHVKNIAVVDEGIKQIENLFLSSFKDDATSFMFTSDHGMTDWGSHGDGSDFETQTVFVGWGAGFKILDKKLNLNQADIAPLISTLLGINIPINSVGTLPFQFLNLSEVTLASALIANTKQLVAQYQIKNAKLKKTTVPILYTPFEYDGSFESLISSLDADFANHKYDKVIDDCQKIIHHAQKGLKYVQKYYRTPLLLLISFGFIFWLVYLATIITNSVEMRVNLYSRKYYISNSIKLTVKIVLGLLFLSIAVFINIQALSNKIYFYALFPVVMLYLLTSELEAFVKMLGFVSNYGWVKFSRLAILYLSGIELIIWSFHDRKYLFVLMFSIGCWLCKKQIERKKKILWFLTTVCLGGFSFLPVMTTVFYYRIFVLVVVSWIYLYYFQFRKVQQDYLNLHAIDKIVYCKLLHIKLVIFVLAAINALIITTYLEYNKETSYISHAISWIILLISLVMISLSPTNVILRIGHIFSSLMGIYIMFCDTIEGPFIVLLMIVLYQWIFYEYSLKLQAPGTSLMKLDFKRVPESVINDSSGDFRKSFFLLSFVIMSFFGTGNIASLSSFNPMWVRCFLTVFSPFTMFALILVKLTIPFLLVLCSFRVVFLHSGKKILNMFCIILFYCDIMVLHFMFFIKDEGSWREIGTQLSNFIIVELITVILIVYYFFAYWLTTNTLYTNLVQFVTQLLAQKAHQ